MPATVLINDEALRGSVRISVAEPLAHRVEAARELQIGLGLPLLGVIPITLIAVALVLRRSLAPVRQFRDGLAARGIRDLSPVETSGLPGEIAPVADTLNTLLSRLQAAFDAERSFAANAAHELRTPLAGAIAQAQRLQSETSDPEARRRAAEIEASLKRLTRVSERLMQMARAEGGRLRSEQASDLRPVLRMVVEDFARLSSFDRLALTLPDLPVLSDIALFDGQDTFSILDTLTSRILMPVGAILTSLFVGWVASRRLIDSENGLSGGLHHFWLFLVRFLCPVALLGIMVVGIFPDLFA